MSLSGSTSFWQSVLNSKKAIFAATATTVAWIGGVLEANGGHNLTAVQWIVAAGAFLLTHQGVYQIQTEKPAGAPVAAAPVAVAPVQDAAPLPAMTLPVGPAVPPTDPAVVAAQVQLDASLAAINASLDQLNSSATPVEAAPAAPADGGTV